MHGFFEPFRVSTEVVFKSHQTQSTWVKEKKTWTVAQRSKVLFSDESKIFISFRNQGLRVWMKSGETQKATCLKSNVRFPLSWFGVLCYLLVLVVGDPLCLVKPRITQPSTRRYGAFHTSTCWQAVLRCRFPFLGLSTWLAWNDLLIMLLLCLTDRSTLLAGIL